MGHKGWITGKFGTVPHRVGVHLPQSFQSGPGTVNGQPFSLAKIDKSPQVVHPGNVVGMSMGKDDPVDAIDIIFNALQAKFRRRVHLQTITTRLDVNGSAAPFVFGICTSASLTFTADHGNTLGSSRTQKTDFHCPECHGKTAFCTRPN